jgi:hypothetical protein
MPDEVLEIIYAKAYDENEQSQRNGKLKINSMRSKLMEFNDDDDADNNATTML